MRIEVNEKVREKFAEEIVNISIQYRSLLKKHGRKLRNLMQEYKILLIILAVVLIIYVISQFTLMEPDTFSWAPVPLLVGLLVLYISLIRNLNKSYRSILAQKGGSVITLDENGAELNRQNAQVVRLAWDNIAFVRVFRECICIFSADSNGLLILADIKYADMIAGWISENHPEIELIR